MSAMYSVWLMPDSASLARLQPIHERLCRQFGTPRFDLHLTLLGGCALDLARLKAILPAIVENTPPFRADVIDIGTSATFFQSFYALFAAQGPILMLKERTMRLALDQGVGAFMPHVSLLYGPVEAGAKAEAAAAARREANGVSIRFDSVTLAYSSDTLPIADWRIEARAPLR
ncbi:MAG TPA: hypothetical protein PK812_08475 [Beijerinckiaceae bacterium]|nr:hypothetical protein [Hyphomonas sp.]HRJ69629.1 hypothetical protein [Beijerinckiaceae bacterium]